MNDLTLSIDPDATPLQQTHRAAMDASLRASALLEPNTRGAGLALARALRCFERAASRPRKAQCWAFVQCELWNARAYAVRAGVLARGSEGHAFVTARYTDATHRLETARRMERLGNADARV